jgi:hypothetical protein
MVLLPDDDGLVVKRFCFRQRRIAAGKARPEKRRPNCHRRERSGAAEQQAPVDARPAALFCRRRMRRFFRRADWDQPVADPGDGLDGEGPAAEIGCDPADPRQHPVDGIVANNAAVPAGFDELVASDDAATCPRERHQHLHDPRLQRLVPLAALDLANGRVDGQRADVKRQLMRQDHAPRNCQTVVSRFPHKRDIAQFPARRQSA